MNFWKTEGQKLLWVVGIFLVCFFLPVETLQQSERIQNALWESLYLVRWYAQEHVILCLLPAFFIAGAIAVFLSQDAVMKYLGAKAKPILAYGVASVSGILLAVCSCTVLPLFAGIYRMGAGLGPATAFLYSGPAINILAIVMTARVLGWQLGLARALGAIAFSVIIGLAMAFLFRKEDLVRVEPQPGWAEIEASRPLWQNALFFAVMVGILVFSNWARPAETTGVWYWIYSARWLLTGFLALALSLILVFWLRIPRLKVAAVAGITGVLALFIPHEPLLPFSVGIVGLSWLLSTDANPENTEWFSSTWDFAQQILPLLLIGVLVAGALLGRPEQEGLIPAAWVSWAVGGNSILANFFAALAGALMYFATLTEIPILQGLLGNGMGQGPALALLLAGPALSLPNMLVIRQILGTRKTLTFVGLVVVMATLSGIVYGQMVAVAPDP
ncbi:MAG: permease [Thermostichus sp. DG_1_6_bins_120]